MPKIKATIDIDAPREHVFAAADPLRMPEWTIHVKEVLVTGGDGKSPGTTDKTKLQITPLPTKLTSVWTEYTQGQVFSRKFSGGLKGEERLTFAPTSTGTHVEWTMNYTPPMGILGQIGAIVMMSRVVQNNMETSLETLKRVMET
ncbi:MAG: SRPBCC family protein [Chloroflexota bacterium]